MTLASLLAVTEQSAVMVVRPENVAPEVHQPEHQRPGHQRQASDALVSDGFLVPDLEAPDEAPPAYGDVLDELHLSQSGFEAGAAITSEYYHKRKKTKEKRERENRGHQLTCSTLLPLIKTMAVSISTSARRTAA